MLEKGRRAIPGVGGLSSRFDDPRTRVAAGAAFIILLTFAAYLPAIRGGFIWDDDQHVTENPLLRSGRGLWMIWTTLGATPQYYPLTHSSFWIEYGVWGANPLGYHIVNVTLHVTSALLVWRILALLNLRGAWLAAAVFAVHPIQVESVAWITERKNVLCGVFFFLAMLAFLKERRLAAIALFACALLSKTVAGTLPGALVVILWWRDGRVRRKDLLWLAPMFAMALVMGSLTARMERTQVGAVGSEWDFTIAYRILIAGRALWFYAGKLLVPYNLTFIYPRWEIDPTVWWQWAPPAAAAGVVVALFLLRHRIGRGPLACTLYFGGTLVPALGFVNVYPMRYSFVADHFQYLSGLGLIVLAVELLCRRIPLPWLAPLPVGLAALTWMQCHMYRDARSLWETTLERNPSAWIAHDHLGAIIGTSDPERALGHYARARELNPRDVDSYIGSGMLLVRLDRKEHGLRDLRDAIALRPDHPRPYYALGVALEQMNDIPGAVREFERAILADDRFIPARQHLVELYTRLGRGDDAARHRAAIQQQLRKLLGERSE
jgi:tetratricopeptide (TPR) repeat protein